MGKKILVICSCNLNRSPTVAKFLKEKLPDAEIKSSGTLYSYDKPLTQELLDWADYILIMDRSQHFEMRAKGLKIDKSKLMLLGLSDQYDRDAPNLLCLLDWMWRNCMFGEVQY